jgi:hypothetical protein
MIITMWFAFLENMFAMSQILLTLSGTRLPVL